MTNMPLLTIAISSYNRAAKLDSQIQWAVASIAGRWDECQLLVADGASTDRTPAVCEKWMRELDEKLTCVRLTVNQGIVAGIYFSIEQAAGEYVWTVGDDDFIKEDAVTTVLDALREDKDLGLLHLNHRTVDGRNGALLQESFYPWPEDQQAKPGQELVEKCLMYHEGGIQFMTANIVKRRLALDAIGRWPDGYQNLSTPIYIYSYAGKDASMRVISNPALDGVYHISSWLPRSTCVYYKDTPEVYLRLKEVGYNKRVMNSLILSRLRFKLITAKALTKFFLKFPLDFTRAIPHYFNALRDYD